MKLFFTILTAMILSSCGSSQLAERKPVPPQGSDVSDKSWNDPSLGGRPGGPLADMMEGR